MLMPPSVFKCTEQKGPTKAHLDLIDVGNHNR